MRFASNGQTIEGIFVDDQFLGEGKFQLENGNFLVGKVDFARKYVLGPAKVYAVSQGSDKLIYEGAFNESGQMNGEAVVHLPGFSKPVYRGYIENGVLTSNRNGTAVEYNFPDGTSYRGQMLGGNFHGSGELSSARFTYKGEFQKGLFHGQGSLTWSENWHYQGEFKNGVFSGHGVLKLDGMDKFTGEFENGVIHGQGVYEYVTGEKYEGQYFNNVMRGEGKFSWVDGDSFLGEFFNDNPFKGIKITKKGDKYR